MDYRPRFTRRRRPALELEAFQRTRGAGRPDPIGSAAGSLEEHLADPDPHPQYTTAAELAAGIAAHEGAADPHPQYATRAFAVAMAVALG